MTETSWRTVPLSNILTSIFLQHEKKRIKIESSWPQDICGMSRLRLSHWFSSHLSVVFYTVAPALIAVIYLYFFSSSFRRNHIKNCLFIKIPRLTKLQLMQGALGRSLYTLHLSHISPTLARFLSLFALKYDNFSASARKTQLHLSPASLWPCHRFGEFLLPGVCLRFPFSHSLSVSLCTLYLQVDISPSTSPSTFSSIIPLDIIYLPDTFICV